MAASAPSPRRTFLSLLGLLYLASLFGVALAPQVAGQGLIDGFFRGAGQGDVTIALTLESADEFFNADEQVDVPPIYRTLTRNTVSLYAAYGLTDNLDLNVPYIFASGDGEGPASELPPQELDNFQDVGVAVKWRPYQAAAGAGTLSLVGGAAASFPVTDYDNGAEPGRAGPGCHR